MDKLPFTVLLLAVGMCPVFSQSVKEEIDLCLARGQELRYTASDSALYYFQHAYHLAASSGSPGGIIRSLDRLANLALQQEQIHRADSLYSVIVNRFEFSDWPGIVFASHMHLGMLHVAEGNLDSALAIFQKMVGLRDQYDPGFELIPERGMADVFEQQGNNALAEKYYLESYERAGQIGKIPLSIALYSLSRFYLKKGDIQNFGKYNQEYLELIQIHRIDEQVFLQHVNSLYSDPEGKISRTHLLAMIEKLKPTGHRRSLAVSYHMLGRLQMQEKDWAGAISTFESAMDIRIHNDLPALKTYPLEQLYKAYDALGDDKKAKEYLAEFHRLQTLVNNTESQKRIDELEVRFQTEQKEKELLRQQTELAKGTSLRNILLISGVLLLFLAVGLGNQLRINRKLAGQDRIIREQNIQSLENENKLLVMNAMISGQEAERKRIAGELHDGLGSLMAMVRSQFGSVQKHLDQLQKLDVYHRTNLLIEQACDEVRRISHDMMPKALTVSGLPDAITDLTSALFFPKGIRAEVEIIGMEQRLNESTEVMIYRIIQELTTNILKYAEARHVLVQLIKRNGMLNILVEDDGIGFDITGAEVQRGMGLKSLRSRVDYLNGTMAIDSVKGQGTTVTITIPV